MGKAKRVLIGGTALMAMLTPAMAAAQSRSFNIAAGSATKSIPEFARQASIQIVAPGEKLRQVRTPAIKGAYDVRQALQTLLKGSGLRVVDDAGSVITLASAAAMARATPALEQSADAQVQSPPDIDEATSDNDIIVTATKRETTLQETAAAVGVVSSDQIEKRNLVGMNDYLASLPGVSYQDRGNGSNTITIRGIGFGDQLSANTPTGSYFGEVPVTGLGPSLNGNQAGNADVKMIDVARVEVLRGPQGTLYGSGSLGGTVRVIPNAPNLQSFEGSALVEYSNTARRGGHNYLLQGVVNLPVIQDRLAVRLVGYRFFNDGYVDNVAASQPDPLLAYAVTTGVVTRDQKHAGAETTTGFRGSLLWQPADGLSVSLMHMYQKIDQDGLTEVELSVSPTDYLQVRPRVGTAGSEFEYVKSKLNISNLVLEYDWDWGNLLNSTSYIDSKARSELSLTFLGPPFIGAGAPNRNHKEVFVNEFRFTSKWAGPVQFVGGLYSEDRTVYNDANLRWNGTGPAPADVILSEALYTDKQKQFAAFGEVAFTPWNPLTLTVGARYYKFDQSIPRALFFGVPTEEQGRKASIDGVNWKVNLAYKASEDVFLYAQWAQGFREPIFQGILVDEFDADNDGLVEFTDGIERKVPTGLLDPDKVATYEAGIKFQALDGKMRGTLTGFYTDWTGIPVVPALTSYLGAALFFNAGKAISKGVEFELSGELPGDWFAQFTTSWVKSTLAADASSQSLGAPGASLPGSPDHNVYFALEKRFNIGENQAYIRGDWTYVSKYYSLITEDGLSAGDYHLFGASAGVTLGNVKLGVFAKNLTNRSDLTWVDNILASGRAYRLRPRTIGINLGVNF
jgi:outer membrane receptor protein involved in Fe transport